MLGCGDFLRQDVKENALVLMKYRSIFYVIAVWVKTSKIHFTA